MSLQHFFLENQRIADEADKIFALDLGAEDLKHIRVLRMQPGEHIAVIDAVQDYYECEIVDAGDPFRVRISQKVDARRTAPHVVLLQGVSKGDKMDDVIRHATELGVEKFIPLMCERSIVKMDTKKTTARTERWQAIARSAAMQSGQLSIPEVCAPVNVRDGGKQIAGATCLLVCWEETAEGGIRKSLSDALAARGATASDATVAIAVGPEGGFTKLEVDRLLSSNEQAFEVTLGPSILRTETAGVVAPALVIYELGGLQ